MSFTLDPTLAADTHWIADLSLSQILLNKNAAFPWLILVPQRDNIVEILDLDETDRDQLFTEMLQASQIVKNLFQPKKLNVANLGNIVAQLHVHVIARFVEDKAWPGPVWNSGVTAPYDYAALQERIELLRAAFLDLSVGGDA